MNHHTIQSRRVRDSPNEFLRPCVTGRRNANRFCVFPVIERPHRGEIPYQSDAIHDSIGRLTGGMKYAPGLTVEPRWQPVNRAILARRA